MRFRTIIEKVLPDSNKQDYKALCKCNICHEEKASIVADSKTNRWECHSCGEKGGVLQHVERNILILDTDRDFSKGEKR